MMKVLQETELGDRRVLDIHSARVWDTMYDRYRRIGKIPMDDAFIHEDFNPCCSCQPSIEHTGSMLTIIHRQVIPLSDISEELIITMSKSV